MPLKPCGFMALLALWLRHLPWERKIWDWIPAYAMWIFAGLVIPVTQKLALQWPAGWLARSQYAVTGWDRKFDLNFCLSVAARKLVWANPSPGYTSMLLGHSATSKQEQSYYCWQPFVHCSLSFNVCFDFCVCGFFFVCFFCIVTPLSVISCTLTYLFLFLLNTCVAIKCWQPSIHHSLSVCLFYCFLCLLTILLIFAIGNVWFSFS